MSGLFVWTCLQQAESECLWLRHARGCFRQRGIERTRTIVQLCPVEAKHNVREQPLPWFEGKGIRS
jgi:hypothetical protein